MAPDDQNVCCSTDIVEQQKLHGHQKEDWGEDALN
jgi:hypothetical protein